MSLQQGFSGRWKLDRHIPIAVLVAIATQTVGVVWWAAKLESRVATLEAGFHEHKSTSVQPDRIATLEAKLSFLVEAVTEIKLALREAQRAARPREAQ